MAVECTKKFNFTESFVSTISPTQYVKHFCHSLTHLLSPTD